MFQKNEADVDIVNLEIGSATATLKKVLIAQVQKNLGIQVGRGNDMFQKNEADAEVANVAVGIANAGADATATAEADAILSKVAIFQLQKNLGIQVGRGNDMFQKNEADADVENVAVAIARADSTNEIGYIFNGQETPLSLPFVLESSASADAFARLSKVAIEQCQANLGIQVGRGNDLFQKNEADADVENVAVARAGTFASNDAEFIQTAEGSVDYMIAVGQYASATASAGASAVLRKAEIEQSQKNLAVQVGIKNDMFQRNEADADVENGAVASAGAFASNDMLVDQFALAGTLSNNGKATAYANNYAYVIQDASSAATAGASAVLRKAEIEQCQANLGVQVGIKNDMSQKNEADAELENGAVASAGAFTSNDMAVDQDAIAGAASNDVWVPFFGWTRGRTATATAGNSLTFFQTAASDASASAIARLSKVEIEQCQANLGVQVGIRNDMFQKNKAEAEMENVAVARAGAFAANDWSVEQDALANAIAGNWQGAESSATATTKSELLEQTAESDASASSSAALGKAKIQQCQANLGVQAGFGNLMIQKNKAEAELENVAVASAGASAPNFQEEIEMSASMFTWPGQTGSDTPIYSASASYSDADSQSASATLSKIWVQQCQKNLGVQVGHNFLVQKNKDECEIEQLAFNTVADLQKISLEQKEKNVMVQVGSSAVFQRNRQTDSPSVSDTHIDRSQSNALVDVSPI